MEEIFSIEEMEARQDAVTAVGELEISK